MSSNLPMKRGPFQAVPAALSFVVPGLGQLYRGKTRAFVFFLVATLLGYSLILPGLVIHLAAVLHAGLARD